MPTKKKAELIDKLGEVFSKSTVGILTNYRGLPTAEMVTLRRKIKEAGGEYKVVKNTLARLAATKAGKGFIADTLDGPIAIAFGYGDIVAPARALAGYISDSKSNLSIRGGFIGNTLLTPKDVNMLATLPLKEIIVARVIGQIKSPLAILVGSISSPIRGFIGILQARMKQLEGN